MSKPITPHEVTDARRDSLPEAVFDVFNAAIVSAWNGFSATVKQSQAVLEIAAKLDIPMSEVYRLRYLDVEPIYRAIGWKVEYEKPGYNETGEAYYKFSRMG